MGLGTWILAISAIALTIFLVVYDWVNGPGAGGIGIDEDELNGYPEMHHAQCPIRKAGKGMDPWRCPDCKSLNQIDKDFFEKKEYFKGLD